MTSQLTMENLYFEMKEALRYFGLSFHQMAEVKVFASKDQFTFSHKDRHIHFKILGPGEL